VASRRRVLVPEQRVDPLPGRISSPFTAAQVQIWTLRRETKPSTIVATVRLRFAVSQIGDCFVARATTDVRTKLN